MKKLCILVGLIFCSISVPAWAFDPITLFLLRMMRDQAISATIESGVSAQQQASTPERPPVPRATPQFVEEGPRLKSLIDESFVYLDVQQREELYASLNGMLNDPKNAAVRATILSDFTAQAIAIRDAHRQLSRMSEADMRRVTASARTEFERLPPDQRVQVIQALQQGVPGMPQALHDMVLVELKSVPVTR